MKWVKFSKYNGDDFGIDANDLMQALADFFLQSGFNNPYMQFQEWNQQTLEDLKRAIQEALESGQLFPDDQMQQMLEKLSAMSPEQLDKLLENLVDNALKYAPSGGHVTVRSAMDGPAPYLEVEDDGPGIPEAERSRVRERFYRLPGSAGIGCGLGLAIVDEIARAHGAVFSIGASADGAGARMRVRFRPSA